MNTGDTVKYAYVTTASSMPVSTDSTTIYFDENEKKISVGDVKFDGGTVPIITEGDEGKVLKVDEGVPKWLEDTDSEYLLVTVTRTGTSPDYTYTADKTYAEIRPFAEKGKVIVFYNQVYYKLSFVTATYITFTRDYRLYGAAYDTDVNSLSYFLVQSFKFTASDITFGDIRYNIYDRIEIGDNTELSDKSYAVIKGIAQGGYPAAVTGYINDGGNVKAINFYVISYITPNVADIVLESAEYRVTIGTDKIPHITEKPKDLLVIVTQSGTAPNYTYTANYTYDEIKAAADAGANIEMKVDGSNAIYHLYNIASNRVQFIRYIHNFNSTPYQDPTTHENLSNLQNISEIIFRFDTNDITKTVVYYQTHTNINLSNTSGTLTDKEYWFVINTLYGFHINYNYYTLFPYYADSTTYKFRDIANTYECVIDVSTKAYTITTI